MFVLIASLLVISQQTASGADVRRPPSLTEQPLKEIQYKTNSDLTLPCVASGTGTLTYLWKKNGTDLDWNAPKVTRLNPNTGTIKIVLAAEAEAGEYQCFVSNTYGKAASIKIRLVCGVLDDFTGGDLVHSHQTPEYQPFQLPCNPPRSLPNATYFWMLQKDTTTSQQIHTDARIQVDDKGNLHFAYVKSDDAHTGWKYSCKAKNDLADKSTGGSYATVAVLPGTTPAPLSPVAAFHSPDTVIGLEGESVLLRCFFSGCPEPTISWKKLTGSLPYPRFSAIQYNSGASITGLQPSDEGVYVCTGTDSSRTLSTSVNITLVIKAVPVFKSAADRPSDRNVTVGDTVKIYCQSYAKPTATIKWYRNAEELTGKLPAKFTLSNDRTFLTITNVEKSYTDSNGNPTWDLMVIQCTASNEHGSIMGQGYINVLDRTVIVNRSEDVQFKPYDTVTFDCFAVSDDSTPIEYEWYFNDDKQPIINDNRTFFITNNRLTIVMTGDADGGASRAGKYDCNASNGYSKATATFWLDPVGNFPVTSSASMWIGIGVGVFLLLLLILLLVLLWFYFQQNKGDSYPVDEKERITGNDPEQELIDSGFHDYQRPPSNLAGPSGTLMSGTTTKESINGSLAHIGSDEDPSLSAYGDRVDFGKFREDGSFLGQYNVNTGYRK